MTSVLNHNNHIRNNVKTLAMACFVYITPVPWRNILCRLRKQSLITVINYHRVDNDNCDINAVSPKNFDRQMSFLKNNYTVISIKELLERMKTGCNDQRLVVITFDDGYLDNFENAAPILKKYNFPACFFISSGIVGTDKPFLHDMKRLGRKIPAMSWSHIRKLHGMGFEIGAHTINHVRLSQCDSGDLEDEIVGSKDMIEEKINAEVSYFSHPHGLLSDVSSTALSIIKKTGFLCNFSAYGGLVQPRDDVFDIKRVGIPNHESLLFFRAWVEGWRTG
ncbi:MAG TPA: polysaccharide deacetylase family protein [Desulfobacterales bacterium]|nr:polysaccharide deacetylase family protein [Desulfobacterales bacterium]